mmetsp:Transcript_24222/g.50347  ORF Transcript_24222/g.50347 Transcript_24222/m.50347 type:complete len:309 (-) Transcript_24222:1246-2172(-)|eukprot:CAMPEP_0172443656 /NCGR_PEP_ID=MMETSP1065-20121228/3876_1 /TAXON_ID=265537 /ORGANISM="Amphiprora paludosa, Strain CCMP125" /LENGTH=308 /DNA_ID=CAMNT_0013193965 /DNA_START=139 /DNA_END=1065 /DNA_ORIENTATION=-
MMCVQRPSQVDLSDLMMHEEKKEDLSSHHQQQPHRHDNHHIKTMMLGGKPLQVSWEPDMAVKIRQLQQAHQQRQQQQAGSTSARPFMVGVVGIPGSGKSTSCEILATLLNHDDNHHHHSTSTTTRAEDDTIVMPMDGYHDSLEELADKFPQATAEAIYRRGAPDTFHPAALERDLDRIAHHPEEAQVSIPGFDHARGDPEPDRHTFVRSQHSIVICEGIYLLHDDHGWNHVKDYFDYLIYIVADVDICIHRLMERNKCLPGYNSPQEIELRCQVVDRVNALTVERSQGYAHEHVWSLTALEAAHRRTR